jgi:hypothetical protein
MSSYQRIPPAAPSSLDQNAAGDVSFPASVVLPNAASTSANLIHMGPLNSTGLRLTRPSSQFLQIANGDSTANATVGAAYYRTVVDGGSGSPGYASQAQPTYGLYINNAGPYTSLVGAGIIGVRVNSQGQANVRFAASNKTSNYTAVLLDSGTIFDNAGAGGQVTITLPDMTSGVRGAVYTVVNQGGGATWMRLQAAGNALDRISYNGTLGAVGGNLTSSTTYASITVSAPGSGGNVWNVIAATGGWTLV